MKNRYIPYGYTIRNGKLVIEKGEAEIIRQIYEQYVAGASLKEIAEQLTKRQVPYSEKTADWGKARVARIIGNTKYLGTDEYDKIIDDNLFEDAKNTKSDRQTSFVPTGLDAEITVIKPRVVCSACGCRMTRKVDKRQKIKAEWTCTNEECQAKVKINDEELMEKVIAIIRRIRENEKLLDMPPINIKPTERQEKLESLLEAELEKPLPNEEAVMNFIAEIANDQYINTNIESVIETGNIKNRLRRIEIREGFQKEADTKLRMGNISLDRATFELSSPAGSYRLANKEYQMMELFLLYPHHIFSSEHIFNKIWNFDSESEINVVWVYISYLRKKLTALGANIQIKASRNAGYSLEDADD